MHIGPNLCNYTTSSTKDGMRASVWSVDKCGIDLENKAKLKKEYYSLFMTDAELTSMSEYLQQDDNTTATVLWTIKECIVKYHKVGFTHSFFRSDNMLSHICQYVGASTIFLDISLNCEYVLTVLHHDQLLFESDMHMLAATEERYKIQIVSHIQDNWLWDNQR